MASFVQYLKDTRGELRHVAWPTQKQTIIYTVLVIVISLIVAAYTGALDYVFTQMLEIGLGVETTDSANTFNVTPVTEDGTPIEVTPVEGSAEGGDAPAVDFDVTPTE